MHHAYSSRDFTSYVPQGNQRDRAHLPRHATILSWDESLIDGWQSGAKLRL